jgi:hypothetical protein
MRALRATAPGEDPTADELAVGLEAAQALIGEIHEARGPMISRDIGQSVTAGENQRLRIQAGASVDVTLPNAVSSLSAFGPQDPGAAALAGTTGSADGRTWRAPDDGARIEIVGTTTALYFYRDDINAWSPATGLTLESESPFNSRLTGAFAALVAERLCDVVSSGPPTPMLQRRIGRARLALASRVGAPRRETVGQYF